MGSAPGSGSAQVGARQGGRAGGVPGSSSVRTSDHSTSGPPPPRTIVPDVLPDQSAQCVECEVFLMRFLRRPSCAEGMRSPAKLAQPQVRDARAAEPVQLLSAAAAQVMKPHQAAAHEAGCRLRHPPPGRLRTCFPAADVELDLQASLGDVLFVGRSGLSTGGSARPPCGTTTGAWSLPRARACG